MEEDKAMNLLLQSAGISQTSESEPLARKVVQEFGCLTLAIVQAGSYISTRGLTLDEYYDIYEKSRYSLMGANLGQEIDYEKPVYATWEISFASLSLPAQAFLKICSFLHREGIPELLFELASKSSPLPDLAHSNASLSSLSILISQQRQGRPFSADPYHHFIFFVSYYFNKIIKT